MGRLNRNVLSAQDVPVAWRGGLRRPQREFSARPGLRPLWQELQQLVPAHERRRVLRFLVQLRKPCLKRRLQSWPRTLSCRMVAWLRSSRHWAKKGVRHFYLSVKKLNNE